MSLKCAPPLSPGRRSDPSLLSSRSSTGRNQEGYSLSDSRRLQNQSPSPLMSTWNGGGSSSSVSCIESSLISHPPSSSSRTSSAGGAVSMPSSPRLGRRSIGNQVPSPSSRQRKYSAGSLNGILGAGHSRSLPRLCPSASSNDSSRGLTLSTLPPRRSDIGVSYKMSKDNFNNNSHDSNHNSYISTQQGANRNQAQNTTQGESVVSISLSSTKNMSSTTSSISTTATPPDVTIPSKAGGSPRVAKKLSLTSTSSLGTNSPTASILSDTEGLAHSEFSQTTELGLEKERHGPDLEINVAHSFDLGERRSSFGKAGLEPRIGLGERRASFGKAGVTPSGGFRERRGSISSLSGKEELTDYHHRQKEERLREQEVERLVSWRVHLFSSFKVVLLILTPDIQHLTLHAEIKIPVLFAE